METGGLTCYRCRRPLSDADFQLGYAIQVGSLASCDACAEPLLARLTPEQRRAALRNAEQRAASAGEIPPEEASGAAEAPVAPRPGLPAPHHTAAVPRVDPPRRKPAVPPAVWIAAAAAAVALVLGFALLGGSREPPDEAPKPEVAPPRAESRATTAPDAAKQAREAEAAKRQRETLRAEIAALEKAVRDPSTAGAYGEALALAEAARTKHADLPWTQAVDRLVKETRDAADGAYVRLKAKALDDQAMEQDEAVRKHREEVARWGIPRFAEDLEKALAEGLQEIRRRSLTGWWKLDETTGHQAADASGNGFDGDVKGKAAWTTGRSGGGLQLNGNDDFVQLPAKPLLNSLQGGDYTAAAWFKPEGTPTRKSSDNLATYAILIKEGCHEGLHFNNENVFCMTHWIERDQKAQADTWDTPPCPPGRFYHLVGVVDRTGGTTRLYVDGKPLKTATWKAGTKARGFSNKPWRIGIAIPERDAEWRWAAKGVIDDVRLYRRALRDAEVLDLFREAGGER